MEHLSSEKKTLGWKEVLVLMGGFLAGQLIVAVIGVAMVLLLREDYATSAPFMMLAYLVTMLCPILAYEIFIEKPRGRRLAFDFNSRPLSAYLLVFPMMIGMMLISEFVVNLIPVSGRIFGPLYEMFSRQIDALSLDNTAMIIMTVFLAPIFEEIVFRGIILKGLLNSGTKPVFAVVISAFIFGAVHFYPWQFAGAFLLGLVLGFVYWKTKSLLLPVLLHAFNNLVSSLLIIFSNTESFSEAFHVPAWSLFIVGLLIFGVSYYLFTRKYRVAFLENDQDSFLF